MTSSSRNQNRAGAHRAAPPAISTVEGPAGGEGPAARTVDVWKTYGAGGGAAVDALAGVSVDFPRGRFTAIMGPSGSGKSTLLHCAAGLDTVTSGQVWIGDTRVDGLNDRDLTALRREEVGFVFQQFNLLPSLTALENITLPLAIARRRPDRDLLNRLTETLGLAERLGHRPDQLSGGQQQRVACARALVTRPQVVFADEPTGNLDSRSSAGVLGFLRDSVRESGQTVVMVTHDPTAASYADQVVFLVDGQVVDTVGAPTAELVLDRMKHLDRPTGDDDRDRDHGDGDGDGDRSDPNSGRNSRPGSDALPTRANDRGVTCSV